MTTPTTPAPAPAAVPKAAGRSATDILNDLIAKEGREVDGAALRGPKAIMLDASKVQESLPDHHIRWVSTKNDDKLTSRRAEGYVNVPAEIGGRSIAGSLTLMAIPRRAYEARVERQKALTKARMSAHKAEHEKLAEGIARELRDRYGLDISAKGLIKTDDKEE